MDKLEHFLKWNYYYKKIGKSVSWGYDIPDSHVLDFFNFYVQESNGRVLDVGCGYGKNASIFIDNGLEYTGIDISKVAILDAKKRYERGEFISGDILTQDFGDKKFDYIIDAGCIHVNPPKNANLFLEKYFNLLEKDGKIFIRIFKNPLPNSNSPLFFIDNFLPVWGYTEEEFKELVCMSGFKIDKAILDTDYYEEDEVFYFYLKKE